jgi:coenzyme PQQ synthesis protein D (PqqD)
MAGESATRWRIRPPDEIAWREVADEVIVLDLRTSMYWALNGSAAVLWIALAEGGTLEELAERLQEQFGVKPDLALHNTSNFLASCREKGLVQKT